MARRFWQLLRPAVFWSYRRGSWQYDVMVALIVAFIFLTPRGFFRDQPRPQQIVMLPSSEPGWTVFLVAPELVHDPSPGQIEPQLRKLVESRAGNKILQLRTEPALDSEGRLQGYLVHARFKLNMR